MRWSPGHRSANVEDRRGAGGGFMRGAGGMGAGGLIILVILSLIFGRDFVSLASDPGVAPSAESGEAPPAETTPEEERLVSFVSFVLDDAQTIWRQISSETGAPYRDAKLVLFRDAVQLRLRLRRSRPRARSTARRTRRCTSTSASTEELQRRASARPATSRRPTSWPTRSATTCRTCSAPRRRCARRSSRRADQANELSVRLELQADCYAGVWGTARRSGSDVLEAGDVEEGLGCGRGRGDDRLQTDGRRADRPSRSPTEHQPSAAVVPAGPRERSPRRLRHLPVTAPRSVGDPFVSRPVGCDAWRA